MELYKGLVWLVLVTLRLDYDRDDEAVNTKDTCHNDGDKWLENHISAEHADLANTDTGSSSAVSSTKVAENESTGDTHIPKEGVEVGVVVWIKLILECIIAYTFQYRKGWHIIHLRLLALFNLIIILWN